MRRPLAPATAMLLMLLTPVAASGQERDLQLTTSIIGQHSCAVSASLDTLRLNLRLRYTNVGKERLILYKGNRLFSQIFISRGGGAAAAAAGRSTVLRTTHSRYFDERPEKIVASAPGSAFTTLAPGASYETTQFISLPVARDGRGLFNVALGAGEHVLNVAASTWYESKQLADDLRQRWRARGLLWTDPLISNAVAFIVAENRPAAAPCR